MKSIKPAFEVTHVNSMQWNRSIAADVLTQNGRDDVYAPEEISPEVLAQVRDAIREEMSKMTSDNNEVNDSGQA